MAGVPVAAKEEVLVVVMEVVLVVAKEEGEEEDSEEGEDVVEGEDLERPAVETAVVEEKERLVGARAAEMRGQSFELDKHAQQLIQNQTWNFSGYSSWRCYCT